MIYIERNALNKVFIDVASYATISNPIFLWNLENSQGRDVVNFVPRNITSTYPSQYAGKYQVFEFSTIPTLPVNLVATGTSVCNIHLPNFNQFWLSIYEQNIPTNTNPNNATRLINQLSFILEETPNDFYSGNTGNTADNIIYYQS
jgi:hypothetical protein